ncbi:MAG: adenosylcobalamin-dependent ribonucleoside-diphosphate reductase [Candidatus Woesearchaeota archaeon]
MVLSTQQLSELNVKKRTGEIVSFEKQKITNAIYKAAQSVGGSDISVAEELSENVISSIKNKYNVDKPLDVEQIQDEVEKILIEQGHAKTAKAFILYREKHKQLREIERLQKLELENIELDDEVSVKIAEMFKHKSKLSNIIEKDMLNDYKVLLFRLRKMQVSGELPIHSENDYISGNDLADNIFRKKYYLKDLEGHPIEQRPEDMFARLSAFMATVEPTEKKQLAWAKKFYDCFYEGYFVAGGRVNAGAGDLYRLKTLSNCFVTLIDDDNIESIYNAAFEAARTYSYGGGIGIDISVLRPKNAVVHNAADHSTGAVSFMELYSLTTGLIGQSGRRGALMLTLDVKHPDVESFVQVKKVSNWVTSQIVEQCKWSNKFDEADLNEIERQVRENTQVRFANISLKVTDEFMTAVEEQNKYGKDTVLVYEMDKSVDNSPKMQDIPNVNYSFGMPSKPVEKYKLLEKFDNIEKLNKYLKENHGYLNPLNKDDLNEQNHRDVFGDFIVKTGESQLAIKFSGDYMLYFNSKPTGEIKKLVKARNIWNLFVEGNYKTAEPGLILWSRMAGYSPSNYLGRPISSTNPCGEVPLEKGGACNLGSVNLSRMVDNGYTDSAEINWDRLGETIHTLVRFLDNVISWNEKMNPLDTQREAAKLTRRIGMGVIGIADMLNQLGMGYDSDEGIIVIEKVMKYIANKSYEATALLAEEKGAIPIFDYSKYSECPFFKEALNDDVKTLIKQHGVRNVATMAIAPTGTISNICVGFREGNKNYIGVSGGVEPIFALYYTRRSESFGNVFFKVFHPTVQAYLDKKGLTEKAKNANEEELKKYLPPYFFRTAHNIDAHKRVRIQGICQDYIDQSISSTVNLPEDIEPETISKIYLDAWKHNLKGITIYREGSRFPILSSEAKKTEFQTFKDKSYKLTGPDGSIIEGKGDTVIHMPDGKLSTVYHLLKAQR